MSVLDRTRSGASYKSEGNNQNVLLTLPISCQICLGKVKDPAVCSNHHAFCRLCLEQWTQKSPFCPACRVTINESNPYKKILGSMDEATQEQINDPSLQSQLRRTRLKMLFEEFHNEIDYLEEKLVKFATENKGLKSENDHLREQLEDSELRLMKMQPKSAIDENSKVSEKNSSENAGGDIATILKLSNKLQEMIDVNESITQVNTSLRKELKNVRVERDMYLEDFQRLKEESISKYPHSPKYSNYALAGLQAKVESYEREIQQLKKALKRADEYIEEQRTELHNSKGVPGETNGAYDNLSAAKAPHESNQTNGLSASDALKKIVKDSGREMNSRDDTPARKWGRSQSARNFIERILTEESQKSNSEKVETAESIFNGKRPSSAPSDQRKVVDAMRFPACAKLIELTKVRSDVQTSEGNTAMTRNLYRSEREYSESNISQENVATSKHEMFVSRNLDGDDITVVLPSSDPPGWVNPEWQYHQYEHPSNSKGKGFLPVKPTADKKEYAHPGEEIIIVKPSSSEYLSEDAAPLKKMKVENEDR